MGLRINQNIAAQNAYRNLSVTDSQMSKSLEKLSSGFRINRAADDAAGLSISEGLRAQIGGLKVAVRNTQDGVSVAQTAEGSLNEVTSILQRMRDLAVQASNSGATDPAAAKAANQEMTQLNAELDRIGSTTAFGSSKLLDGSFGSTRTTSATNTAIDHKDAAAGFNATGMAAIFGTGTFDFTLTTVGGKALTGTDQVVVQVPQFDATTASIQDVAGAVNDAIKEALTSKTGANYQGTEVSVTADFTKDGKVTFNLSGAGDFVVADDDGGLGALGVVTGGLTSDKDIVGGNTGQFQVGANTAEKIGVRIGAVNSGTLGTKALSLTDDPDEAISVISKALQSVSDARASLGAYQNRFEHTINNLNVAVENLSASESRIRDTDMAQEMVSFTRSQILTQAGTSMLSQANQSAQNVLSLLR
jgi:flagellin